MQQVEYQQVIACLKTLDIKKGDGLLVHSAIQFLGKPVGGIVIYKDAIMQVIGPSGTLVVPTFNFDFANGESYDRNETPSKGMGVFSEYIRQLPEAQRTSHPMQSVAAVGRFSEDLASRDTISAFDPDSAFERMLELDFKILLLGADISAVSLFHYSEHRFEVPYRYWKDFPGQVRSDAGWEERTYRMFVRDLEINPILTAEPVQTFLEERNQWRSVKLNYGRVSSCRLVDFVDAVDHFLARDPWMLVTNPPPQTQKSTQVQPPN